MLDLVVEDGCVRQDELLRAGPLARAGAAALNDQRPGGEHRCVCPALAAAYREGGRKGAREDAAQPGQQDRWKPEGQLRIRLDTPPGELAAVVANDLGGTARNPHGQIDQVNAEVQENPTTREALVPAEIRATLRHLIRSAEAPRYLLEGTEPALVENLLQHALVRGEARAMRAHEPGMAFLGGIEDTVQVFQRGGNGLLTQHVYPLPEEERSQLRMRRVRRCDQRRIDLSDHHRAVPVRVARAKAARDLR